MPPIGDLLAQITGEPGDTYSTDNASQAPKRKASEQLLRPVEKLQRREMSMANSSQLYTQTNRPTTGTVPMAKTKGELLGQKQSPVRPSTSTTFKNGQPTPPPTNDAPKPPPKKGSFAEIMARAKAAQSTLGQIGKIQHKAIEKLPSKREREDMRTQRASKLQKDLAPESKFSKMGKGVRANGKSARKGAEPNGKGRAEPEPEKKVKKAALATTGYTGTSRPKPGSASKSCASTSSSRYDRGADRNRYQNERYGARYAFASEDEVEDEEGEEADYESDLSDMEAAAFEVDDEEEEAARIARREDAAALAEENRLKREKEEKRRRLAAMAKARR